MLKKLIMWEYTAEKRKQLESLGLTSIESDSLNSPYVDEFPFILECKVRNDLDLGSDM